MRKGLRLTLLTVAIALISVQAMASAPLIGDIPSPIIGDLEPVTDGGKFIAIDLMNLDNLATDDATPSKDLMWTYWIAPSGHYSINAVPPVNLTLADITSPTTSRIINRTVGKGPAGATIPNEPEYNLDGKASTITIRNTNLSALGTGLTVDEGWDGGIINAESALVTFYCSDGTSYSSKTVMFYTASNDYDHLSGNLWKPVRGGAGTDPKVGIAQPKPNANGWKPEAWIGSVTSSTWAGSNVGLCLSPALLGTNMAEFASPMPYFQLTKNTVYRIKVQMNSTQGTVGKTPLWDLIVENNVPGTPSAGMMAYNSDTMFFDDPNNGGANTIINTQNGTWKEIYWAPPAVDTPQWNNSAFDSKYDGVNDPRLRFRTMDVDGVGMGYVKSGSICIQNILIDQIPLGCARVVKNLLNIAPGEVKQAKTDGSGNIEAFSMISPLHVTITFANGAVTIKPTATSVKNSYDANGDGVPESSSTGQFFDFTEIHSASDLLDSTIMDNWPFAWEKDTIYRVQVGLSAPTPTDAAHPWDAVFLSMYSKTYELFVDSFMTSRDSLGSPTYATDSLGKIVPQTYTLFYQSGKGSFANAENNRLKWVVRLANTPAVAFPSTLPSVDPLNLGAVTFHSVRVDKVEFVW